MLFCLAEVMQRTSMEAVMGHKPCPFFGSDSIMNQKVEASRESSEVVGLRVTMFHVD